MSVALILPALTNPALLCLLFDWGLVKLLIGDSFIGGSRDLFGVLHIVEIGITLIGDGIFLLLSFGDDMSSRYSCSYVLFFEIFLGFLNWSFSILPSSIRLKTDSNGFLVYFDFFEFFLSFIGVWLWRDCALRLMNDDRSKSKCFGS